MPNSAPELLSIRGLNAGSNEVAVLKDIELTLQRGEILALCGPNGAGKSSLLRSISGDMSIQSGSIEFTGRQREQFGLQELARGFAYLPQHSELNFPFESQQVVMMGRTPHASGAELDHKLTQQVLREMDISELSRRHFTQLSGGEKQRVQLARVLCQIWRSEDASNRLLLLDEPCNALDVAHAHRLMRSLQQLAAGELGVIMVLHDLNLAVRYADRIAVMNKGAIAALGEPKSVITPDVMRSIFNVNARLITDSDSGALLVSVNE